MAQGLAQHLKENEERRREEALRRRHERFEHFRQLLPRRSSDMSLFPLHLKRPDLSLTSSKTLLERPSIVKPRRPSESKSEKTQIRDVTSRFTTVSAPAQAPQQFISADKQSYKDSRFMSSVPRPPSRTASLVGRPRITDVRDKPKDEGPFIQVGHRTQRIASILEKADALLSQKPSKVKLSNSEQSPEDQIKRLKDKSKHTESNHALFDFERKEATITRWLSELKQDKILTSSTEQFLLAEKLCSTKPDMQAHEISKLVESYTPKEQFLNDEESESDLENALPELRPTKETLQQKESLLKEEKEVEAVLAKLNARLKELKTVPVK